MSNARWASSGVEKGSWGDGNGMEWDGWRTGGDGMESREFDGFEDFLVWSIEEVMIR